MDTDALGVNDQHVDHPANVADAVHIVVERQRFEAHTTSTCGQAFLQVAYARRC
jgi:hypothetical protein